MKKLLLLLLTIVSLQAKAQFINLPDSNLRNGLITLYPSIFNSAKQMDTVKAKVLTTGVTNTGATLRNRNITNLSGIEYVGRIIELDISSNLINTNFKLPINCSTINLLNCGLTSIPAVVLNSTKIKGLNVSSNSISLLPVLSDSLTHFLCANNLLTSLPQLPSKLYYFDCQSNQIAGAFPTLPQGLNRLYCKNNLIASLPTLPNQLAYLDCENNKIAGAFPNLPNSLILFNCNKNLITSLSTLPNSLKELYCNNNLLTAIANLPVNTDFIDCSNNLLTAFPDFPTPNSIIHTKYIWFNNNKITNLPNLNNPLLGTYNLNISYNPLTNINDVFKLRNLEDLNISGLPINKLPDTIKVIGYLSCNHNKLNKLPVVKAYSLSLAFTTFDTIDLNNIPETVFELNLSYSNVTKFPKGCQQLILYGRKDIKCFSKLPEYDLRIWIDSGQVTCLPNKIYDYSFGYEKALINTKGADSLTFDNYIKSGGDYDKAFGVYTYSTFPFPLKPFYLPLCNPTNNTNNCASFPNIVGSIYVDENNNNTKDPIEPFRANVPVRLKANNKTVTNANGAFVLMADSIGSQTLTVTAPRFYTAVPNTVNLSFGRYDTLVNVPPIALQKTISKDSLAVKITPIWWAARPGFPYPFLVQYENVGSNTVNANINLTYNNAALDYDSSSTTVTPTAGNIQLLRNSFTPGSQGAFVSYFRVKPSATLLGTNLKTWVSIAGGTALASDTTRRIIGGSYDPNDKLATPQLTTTQVAEGQFINYTVRFQNTGTDTAFTVVIADTLNSLLQANTFEMLGSSHTCKTIIQDNKIYFEFRNILLPDSTTNLIGSNGFVNFRIKPISNVALNTSIPNKAAIYFDYNEPIITNTANTLISNTILPLQLVRFSVLYKQSSGVLFNWETKNEQAVKEFVVEESKDAINFKALQQTQSKGNGDNNYFTNANYAANEMVGSKFYRLKTISNNGNIAYSQIVRLNFDKGIQPFIILQNPVKGSLQVQVNAQSLNHTEALLISQEGKVVQGFKLQLGSQTISLGNLGAGVYTLKTVQGSSLVVVK